MTENLDVKLDLMSSSGLRVIEQTKKRLFSPAQKEKIKRRSLMQAGVTETSEGENETYTGRSYKSNGHLRFKISDGKQSKALQNLENEFQFDWLAPHEGTEC